MANAVTAEELSGKIGEEVMNDGVFVSVAAWIGTTRLIDNIVLRKEN